MQLRFCIRITLFVILVGMVHTQASDLTLEWISLIDRTSIGNVSALSGTTHRLYAGTSEGVFYSENDGNTWLPTGFDIRDNESLTTLTATENTVYAGTWRHGVFRSDDAGITWIRLNEGFRFQEVEGEPFYGEVRRILIIGDTTISVMYHGGTYTSTDRGETWQDVSEVWYVGDSIYSMTLFDGYLWSAMSVEWMARSPDDGQTWQPLVNFQQGRVNDWAELNGQLYVAGQKGVGRWNETMQEWEYLINGLPIGKSEGSNNLPYVSSLAVRGGLLFAGLWKYGVYVFDAQSEIWSTVGLQELSVSSLLSHGEFLYTGTERNGIYRAKLQIPTVSVQPQRKVVTTWANMKRTAPKGD